MRRTFVVLACALTCTGCGLSDVGADKAAWRKAQEEKEAGGTEQDADPTDAVAADGADVDASSEDGAALDMTSMDATSADAAAVDGDPGDVGSGAGDVAGDAGAQPDGAPPADVPPPECVTGTDCAGALTACKHWQCSAGKCVSANAADGEICALADLCAAADCAAGACVATGIIPCDDGDPCTFDGCAPQTGCFALPDPGAVCDDGDACTLADTCDDDGKCAGGSPKPCDDGNVCTADSCVDKSGTCAHLPGPVTCTDDDKCTVDACAGDTCTGQAIKCFDDEPCTDDNCLAEYGCTFNFNTAPCDDGNPCSVLDTCVLAKCVGKSGLFAGAWKPGGLASWIDGIPTADGGAVLLGLAATGTHSWIGRREGPAGEAVWTKPLAAVMDDERPALTGTADGDFLALGSTVAGLGGLRCQGVRFDAKGVVKWSQAWAATAKTRCLDVGPLSGGQHVVAGTAVGGEVDKAALLLVGADGNASAIGTVATPAASGLGAVTGAADGAVACGRREVGDGGDRAWIVGVDSKLGLRWQHLVRPDLVSACTALAPRPGGGWVGAGHGLAGEVPRPLVFATNGAGRPTWSRLLPGAGGLAGAWPLADGVVVVGMAMAADSAKALLTRLSADGRTLWSNNSDLGAAYSAWSRIRVGADGRLLLLGLASENLVSGPQHGVSWRIDPWGHSSCAAAGKCGALMAKACADGDDCTDDGCSPAAGCAPTPHGGACDDGKACATVGRCVAGACKSGPARLWQQVYDDPLDALADALSTSMPALTALPAGGWAAASRATKAGAGVNALVLRLDGGGQAKGAATSVGGSGDQLVSAVAALADGGLVLGGQSTPGASAWLLFLDGKDAVVGQHKVKVGDAAAVRVLLPQAGGQALAVGHTSKGQGKDAATSVLLLRANASGVLATATAGLPGFSLAADCAIATGPNQVAIGGRRWTAAGTSEVLLALLNHDGKIAWRQGLADAPTSGAVVGLARLPDGGLVVAANTLNKAGAVLPTVFRTAPSGGPIWQWQLQGNNAYPHGRLAAMVARPDGSVGLIGRLGGPGSPANVFASGLLQPGGDGELQPLSLPGVNVPAAATLTAQGEMVVAIHAVPTVAGQHRLRLMRINGWGQFDCKVAGACGDLAVGDCGAGLPCSLPVCDPVKGCALAPGKACDDGLHCTVADTCADGTCQPGSAADCEDDNGCTNDACTPTAGCSHVSAEGMPCQDGAFCTIQDACKDSACAGKPRLCADAQDCTADSCDEVQDGCLHKPDNKACDDGVACTTDTCEFDNGCTHATNAKLCDDGNVCTANDCALAKGCQTQTKAPGLVCGQDKVCSGTTCTIPWAVALGAGDGLSCAIQSGGQVWCWGADKLGQLGGGKAGTASAKPVPVPGVSDAKLLDVGTDHACASAGDLGPTCWGSNEHGKANWKDKSAIIKPTLLGGDKISDIATMRNHTCALTTDGKLTCWGQDAGGTFANVQTAGKAYVSSTVGQSFQQLVTAGGALATTCLLDASYGPFCAGYSMLVANPKAPPQWSPTFLPVLTAAGKSMAGVTGLRSSPLRVLALNKAGEVWAWGPMNDLAPGWKFDGSNLIKMPGKVVDAATGYNHICAVLDDGSVWCVGTSGAQTVGDVKVPGGTTAVQVPGLSHMVAIAAGKTHTCALRADGAVLCWGSNTKGECGTGGTSAVQVPTVVGGTVPAG